MSESSAFLRWRELHSARFSPHPDDFADPVLAAKGEHDPLCVWDGQRVLDPCFGCELVALRSDASYEEGELREVAREALQELLDIVRGHLADVDDGGMELWSLVTPLLDWPSLVRGPMKQDLAARLLVEPDPTEDFPGDDSHAVAYLMAAYVAENELSDGRGGGELYEAAQEFCAALERYGD